MEHVTFSPRLDSDLAAIALSGGGHGDLLCRIARHPMHVAAGTVKRIPRRIMNTIDARTRRRKCGLGRARQSRNKDLSQLRRQLDRLSGRTSR
ncbi:hypothetical protein MRX96_050298 [Rhipicephalus microplus]